MSPRLELATPRLTLVAATLELAEAEIADHARFARLLGAEVPPGWPPPFNDESTMRWMRDQLAAHSDHVGWVAWYFLLRRAGVLPLLVGNGGFKGKFVAPGTCEIGYSVMESHQRRGYATEAVTALVAWAFADPAINRVVAHTFPELAPSIRVLEKNGFTPATPLEPEAIMFERFRSS